MENIQVLLCQASLNFLVLLQRIVFFSVTRGSRSDVSEFVRDQMVAFLMSPWWVRIPTGDLTDVTLVSEDTDKSKDDEDVENDEEDEIDESESR